MQHRYLLTELERDFFACWLEHEAASDETVVAELRSKAAPEMVVRRHVAEVAAERIVAAKLRAQLSKLEEAGS
jgi:hypothetical protein